MLRVALGQPEREFSSRYEMKETLGKGKYGEVKKAVHLDTKQVFAVKIINKKIMSQSELLSLRLEIEIGGRVCHPNVIQMKEVFETQDEVFLILEYLEGGDLYSHLKTYEDRQMPEHVASQVLHQLAMALYYLKSEGIVHRDLKPENVMLSGKFSKDGVPVVKIMDFGLSAILGNGELARDPFGTLTYVAPEILFDEAYAFQVDVYSLGSLYFQMLSGRLPFNVKSEKEMVLLVTQQTPKYDKGFLGVSRDTVSLLKYMLEKEPERRASIEEVLKHDTIAQDLAPRRESYLLGWPNLALFATSPE